MPKGTFDLKAWALVGAQQRLRELDEERAAIFAAFPQLRAGTPGRRPGRPAKDKAGETPAGGVRKRKRRKMSKEARAKISAAQRARWAKQKKAEKAAK